MWKRKVSLENRQRSVCKFNNISPSTAPLVVIVLSGQMCTDPSGFAWLGFLGRSEFVGHSGIQWKGFDKIGGEGEEEEQEIQRIVCEIFHPLTPFPQHPFPPLSAQRHPPAGNRHPSRKGVGCSVSADVLSSFTPWPLLYEGFQGLVCCMDLWDLLNGLNVLIRHKESITEGMTRLGDERKEPGHLMSGSLNRIFFSGQPLLNGT